MLRARPRAILIGWWDWFERFRDGAANNVGGDTFRSRMMLKIAEKLGFQTGTMVEVCKNRRLTAFFKANNLDFGRPWRQDL